LKAGDNSEQIEIKKIVNLDLIARNHEGIDRDFSGLKARQLYNFQYLNRTQQAAVAIFRIDRNTFTAIFVRSYFGGWDETGDKDLEVFGYKDFKVKVTEELITVLGNTIATDKITIKFVPLRWHSESVYDWPRLYFIDDEGDLKYIDISFDH